MGLFYKISKFSVKMFLLILLCVAIPFTAVCVYIRVGMEQFIQQKMSERIIQDISRGERNIAAGLQELAALSNAFVFDEELIARIRDGERTQFENVVYFDDIIEKLQIMGGNEYIPDMKVILFDEFGRTYSNWELNYENYQYLLDQDWVAESKNQWGHVTWSMFSPPYIPGDQRQEDTYISLARSVMEYGTTGRWVGTLIISISQSRFSELLLTYASEGDLAFVCVEDGDILLTNDREGQFSKDVIWDIRQRVEEKDSGSLQCSANGREYLMSYYTIPRPWVFDGRQLKVFHFTDYQEILDEIRMVTTKMNAVIVIMLFLIMGISYAGVRILVKPITVLTKKMGDYTVDSRITGIDTDREDEIGHLNKAFCRLDDNIKQLFERLKEENKIKEQYRYESLRAQLNPHFLFNTLTTIRWMAMIRGANNIVDSIDALAHVLKYSMSRDNRLVTLEEELCNIRNFIYIHNYRYQDYCKLDVDIPEELMDLQMMKFILQPVVENAIIHGYDKDREQMIIRIYGYTEEEKFYLFVEDDGIGISEQVIEQFQTSRGTAARGSKMTGIGLDNVDSCIRITFGETYGLRLERCGYRGTSVTFVLPVIRGEENDDEEDHDCG